MNNRILNAIDIVLRALCCVFIAVITVLLVLQVAMRYGFNASLFWIEEVCSYMLVSVTFLGGALAFGRREHITVDFIFEVLASRSNKILRYLVDIIVFAFCFWGLFASWDYVVFSMGKKSFTTGLPTGVGYIGVPIAFALICIQCLCFIYMRSTGKAEARYNDAVLD